MEACLGLAIEKLSEKLPLQGMKHDVTSKDEDGEREREFKERWGTHRKESVYFRSWKDWVWELVLQRVFPILKQ